MRTSSLALCRLFYGQQRFWFSRGFQPSKVELLQLLTGHNIRIYYLFTFSFTWAKGKNAFLHIMEWALVSNLG